MIGRTISHYEIVEQIGDGGMGSVYKALDTKLQVHRALKFIHPHLVSDTDFKQRFIQEAQAASALDHPAICTIHEVDETEAGRPFICMSYYDGETLAERLKEGPLPPREVFRVGYAVAAGLGCAHQNRVVHRDIKPANVMLTAEGFVRILDFGLAKLTDAAGLTRTGQTLGTVRYMAPEQTAGGPADHRSDIWALGLHHLRDGHRPIPLPGGVGPSDPLRRRQHRPRAGPSGERGSPRGPLRGHRALSRQGSRPALPVVCRTGRRPGGRGGRAGGEAPWEKATALLISHGGSTVGPAPSRPWVRIMGTAALVMTLAAGLVWWTSRPPPVYTTEVRLAVMPLENQAHFDRGLVVDGMSDVVYRMFDRLARRHDSMWVVPNRLVRYAELGEDSQAKDSFGVNRIVTGGLQRFQGGEALLLVLRDAATLEQLQSARIPFDPESSAFADSLPGGLVALMEVAYGQGTDLRGVLPQEGAAVAAYLKGLGALQRGNAADAAVMFATVTDDDQEFAAGWDGQGWAQWQEYLRTGEGTFLRAAVEYLEKALMADPEDWWPRFHLGEVLRRTGDMDDALAVFREADRIDPGTR